MRIFSTIIMLGLGCALAGCASLSYPLPKCDGYAKRPLNPSMWDWEDGRQTAPPQHSSLSETNAAVLSFLSADEAVPTAAVAFAGYDEAASYRACRAG